MTSAPPVLPAEAVVANVGLPLFAESVAAQGRSVAHLDWTPPAGGDPANVRRLTTLYAIESIAIDRANAEVLGRLDSGTPMLVDVLPAAAVLAALEERTLLHAGPTIGYEEACDPLRRSMRAATVAEGWAETPAAAHDLLAAGGVTLLPANDHGAVVPMATALGPTTPVWVADDAVHGTRGVAPVNQGSGDVAWFGKDTQGAIDRLRFLRDVAQPRLAQALRDVGPLDIMSLASQGVHMGDDVHIRVQATTNLALRDLLPGLAGLAGDSGTVALASFLSKNHLFFLTIAMAGAKALTRAAETVEGSTVVTTMARNGTTFGLKLAGSDTWHITAAPPVADALYYPGYSGADAALDIGDSAVLELVGLGGAAAAGSPAVAAFLGGSMADAARATDEMRQICLTSSTRFTLPIQGYRGTPLGVDVRQTVSTGLRPKVTTGILHVTSGAGQIGAGVATAPVAAFELALAARADAARS